MIELGTPSRLVEFFKRAWGAEKALSINDFRHSDLFTAADRPLLGQIWLMCERLSTLGVLIPVGGLPLFGACYVTLYKGNRDASYGVFDHLVFGFPYIRDKLAESVLPIVVPIQCPPTALKNLTSGPASCLNITFSTMKRPKFKLSDW